jgi:hypothetical protein
MAYVQDLKKGQRIKIPGDKQTWKVLKAVEEPRGRAVVGPEGGGQAIPLNGNEQVTVIGGGFAQDSDRRSRLHRALDCILDRKVAKDAWSPVYEILRKQIPEGVKRAEVIAYFIEKENYTGPAALREANRLLANKNAQAKDSIPSSYFDTLAQAKEFAERRIREGYAIYMEKISGKWRVQYWHRP